MSGKHAKLTAKRRDQRRIRGWRSGVTVGLCVAVIAILLVCGWVMTGDQGPWGGWLESMRPEQPDSSPDGMTGRLAYRQQQPAELGVYSVMRYDDLADIVMRVDFRLVGETSCPNEGSFEQFMEANADSFRKQVCRTVREARLTELSDPELLARKIAMQINRVHQETFLHSVELEGLEIFEEIEGYSPVPWEAVAAE